MGSASENLSDQLLTAPPAVEINEEAACKYVLSVVSSCVVPMTLMSAVDLGILEIIKAAGADKKLTADEIVKQLPTENPNAGHMVDRMLQLLAGYSIVTCSVDEDADGKVRRSYGTAPPLKFLTKDENGVSMGALALMNNDKVLIDSWYHMKDAVLEGGIPFNRAHGMMAFEYHAIDPRFNKVFNAGMSNHTTIVMNKILDNYRGFDDVKVLVDVGGGIGASLHMIVCRHPHIKGINFDLPHAISEAPAFPGVEHVAGDMFAGVPSGDAIFMKWILHDWSDDHCIKVLKNCHKALPDDGKVIVIESILPDVPDPRSDEKTVSHVDMIMLAVNPGGKERTVKQFEALAKEAGFSGFKRLFNYSFSWVMEFTK